MDRVKQLSRGFGSGGEYILYWMQQSQRVFYNHALNFAISKANKNHQPLMVLFVLTNDFPQAENSHYVFMLEGLQEVQEELQKRGVTFIIRQGDPVDIVSDFARQASIVVFDGGYLRIQKSWRNHIRDHIENPIYQVESDVVIPVETASNKREYMARTLRPKIHAALKEVFEDEVKVKPREISEADFSGEVEVPPRYDSVTGSINPVTGVKIEKILEEYREKAKKTRFTGGHSTAVAQFRNFVKEKLPFYADKSNDPGYENVSLMSPYLHFGQISPLELIHLIQEHYDLNEPFVRDYLEQLIVRRELAVNFVHYTEHYDSLDALPDWARKTLEEHANDAREYLYTFEELEQGKTHDEDWNTCMEEMRETGFMHGHMRMYWGKKIIEWTESPEIAFDTLIKLNNRYFLDGRDPVSYTSILWLFGLHDQAWKERPIFGKIRYMNQAGLHRKFNMKNYEIRIKNDE
ncbi:deoxyribodipyrimidine photo-lyase [Fidelibacter multiformis]|uniref:deoxyribodipyrimidine photo-lyase n=1 Tax=Fidelibacter multiformis TaxID=3377529 RepID=UPI0037DCAD24